MKLETHSIAALVILSITLALPAPPLQAGGDGSGGRYYGTPRANWDLVEDFMYGYLLGPRIDPYWYGDQADVLALDERIYNLESMLGYSGLPLTSLREDLDLGMTRGQYDIRALIAIGEIGDELRGSSEAPMAYRGYIGRNEITCILRWYPDGYVSGLYHHAPARGDLRAYVLQGHNRTPGKLYLLEANGSTQSARLYFEKRIRGDEIAWEGYSHASSGRVEPALLVRYR